MFFQKIKKTTISFVLSVLIFSSIAGFFISASPANAQAPVAVAASVPDTAHTVWDTIASALKIAVLNAAQQSVSYFLRKIAYDSAVWMASGGKGQKPFFEGKGFGDYMSSVASETAGTAIEQLGKGFGVDLCKMPDVKLDLAFRIGLHFNYSSSAAGGGGPAKPACNLDTFSKGWDGDAWRSKYGNGNGNDFSPGKVFSSSLKVDDSPLGVAMKTTEKIDRLVARQTAAADSDRKEGGGFNAMKKLISNDIKVPSAVIAQEAKANAPSEQNKKSEAQINAAMGAGAYQIIPSTLALFLNTLAGQMLTNFKENGMLPGGICVGSYGGPDCKTNGGQATKFEAGTLVTGRSAAEAAFSEFLVSKLNAPDNFDILAQLNSCESRGLYNCRVDSKLILAIQQAKEEPVTIREALDKGWLNGGWKIISPKREFANADSNCFNTAYCYSNIQVLRQLSIMPLGLEIAAKNSDPDSPWTLKEVVDGFYDCNYDKDANGKLTGQINYDPDNKPFCHLVDPNWVIKLPQTRCAVSSFSSVPLGMGVPNRLTECLDLKTCVGQDKDGNCAGFGNCVREKNVWKFNADGCDPQYATCRSFVDSTGKSVSYLYRTLNTEDCSQDTAGCAAYSLEQDDTGKWKSVAPTDYGNYSTGIYLNKNVSTACSADSVGCSAFNLAGGTNTESITLKKAPDYLHCYDADAKQDNGTQWPKTFSDIFKMKPRPECDNYAKVCIADEVGCATYTSAADAGATPIPGKFTSVSTANGAIVNWNDQCDEKCVGYGVYREIPSNYAAGTPLAYIIPPSKYNNQSGVTCKKADVSCSSFTNMAQDGGEKVEYFTDLRVCIKPDLAKQKNFYTYEGSAISGGYQLKSYILEKDLITGAPKTVFLTEQDKTDADTYKCNANLYKAGNPDPDCRQFNDDKGSIYYAMLSHTVVVSADCTSYRLNSSELAVSDPGKEQCFGNGEYKEGSCFYNGLPTGIIAYTEASKTCTAPVVSCREYKGNNGNNIQTLLTENFENQDSVAITNGWGSTLGGTVAWTVESTHVKEHSLGYSGASDSILKKTVDLKYDSFDAQSNISYNLSFWAKGSGVNVDISMTDEKTNSATAGTITANTSWQYFTFNLLELQSAGTSTINFKLKDIGNLFLDNVRLTKVSEYLYLVKDSLKVDSICDDNQTDNLPGVALGCSAYVGPPNSVGTKDYFLTNFSFLCREGALGCTAFIDTFNKKVVKNNDKIDSQAYNVSLIGQTGTKASIQIDDRSFSCQIEQGKSSCYLKDPISPYTKDQIITAGGVFVTSTYFIPADTSSTEPIYLVANEKASCNAANLGCTLAGRQKSTPSGFQFETTTIKLDPALLVASTDVSGNPVPGILCHEQALGCGVYDSSLGEAYFKDPAVIGAKVCAYNPNITINNNKVSGWFWKGVGACGNTSTQKVASPYATCVNDNDCSTNNGCINTDQQPCYPNYIQNGDSYGLWSFGNKDKYNNFVGECPADQNACTEFVDHNDSDKTYYFLKNAKISAGNCDGMISQKAGCVLFDQTDNPNKSWNTAAAYLLSDNYVPAKGSDPLKVTKIPLSESSINKGTDNDANILIKVTRDRECAEWMQCERSKQSWDDKTNKWKESCEKIGRCDRLPANAKEDNPQNCANFINHQHSDSEQLLSAAMYINRDIRWSGHDYDGFSILGMYPLEELGQFDISADNSATPDWRLGKPIVCGGNNCPANSLSDYACDKSGVACGKNNEGICFNKNCISDPFGNKDEEIVKTKAPKYACRAYPDSDSPFPNLISNTVQGFSGVNKCNEYQGDDAPLDQAFKCDCDYSKITFGNGIATKYLNYDSPSSTKGDLSVCTGGTNDGKYCDSADIGTTTPKSCPGGICQIRSKMTKFLGWHGQCLEPDLSRTVNGQKNEHPCLTWLPVDKLQGTIDIDSLNPTAGFIPNIDHSYCLSGKVYKMPAIYSACRGDGDSWDMSCDDSECEATGKAFCEQYPGYTLATRSTQDQADQDKNPYGKSYFSKLGYLSEDGASWPYCGYTVEDNAPGSIKQDDGSWSCETGTGSKNLCAIRCVLDPNAKSADLLSYGNWTDHNISFFSEQKVGCQIDVKIDKNDIAWTDNIWAKKVDGQGNPFSLIVENKKGKDFLKKINYNFSSPSNPFARLTTLSNANLIQLMYCNTSPISMPLSDGSCTDPKNEIKLKVDDKDVTNLTYGTWTDGGGGTCEINSDCNGSVKCEGATKKIKKEDYWCERFCKQNSDCSFSFINEKTQKTINASLGICKGYKASKDGKPEVLGACKKFLENACGSHVYGDIQDPDKCYKDPNDGSEYCTPGQKYQDISQECLRAGENTNTIPKDKRGLCVQFSEPGKCSNGGMISNSTSTCLNDYDCFNNICVKNAGTSMCVDPTNKPPALTNIILETLKTAFYEFQQLFARVSLSNFTIFSSSTALYVPLTDVDKTVTPINLKNDITGTGNDLAKPTAPTVHSVGPCNSDTDPRCIENNENNITVNGRSDGNVRITSLPHTATIQFFAYADKNQMPINQIIVNWGDGKNSTPYGTPGSSSFLNQRGVVEANKCTAGYCNYVPPGNNPNPWINPVSSTIKCKSNYDCNSNLLEICKSDATDFGTILKGSCDPHYFASNGTYDCLGPSDKNWCTNKGGCDTDTKMHADFPDGYCIFTPSVQVLDNWGWCNGVCGDDKSPGGVGCYNDMVSKNNECEKFKDIPNQGAYTPFKFKVLVAPNKIYKPIQ